MFDIVDNFYIPGRGKVVLVKFQEPQKRDFVCSFLGKKINGEEIVGVELRATGEGCLHKDAGFLVRNKNEDSSR